MVLVLPTNLGCDGGFAFQKGLDCVEKMQIHHVSKLKKLAGVKHGARSHDYTVTTFHASRLFHAGYANVFLSRVYGTICVLSSLCVAFGKFGNSSFTTFCFRVEHNSHKHRTENVSINANSNSAHHYGNL